MKILNNLKRDFAILKERKPLVHHITNYVAMNDSANAVLAIGASPIMAHAHSELSELVSSANSLLINIGTLDDYWIQSMHIACRTADKKIPILLDPVGAGATRLRTIIALQILSEYSVSAVKGNYGEMMSLMGEENAVKGVDSLSLSFDVVAGAMRDFSVIHNTIAIATGERDIISDGKDTYIIKNGTPKLGSITASGCMLGSVIASFMAVQKNPLIASIEGVAVYNIAGEMAERARGVGSFRSALLDALSTISAKDVEERLKIEKL